MYGDFECSEYYSSSDARSPDPHLRAMPKQFAEK